MVGVQSENKSLASAEFSAASSEQVLVTVTSSAASLNLEVIDAQVGKEKIRRDRENAGKGRRAFAPGYRKHYRKSGALRFGSGTSQAHAKRTRAIAFFIWPNGGRVFCQYRAHRGDCHRTSSF